MKRWYVGEVMTKDVISVRATAGYKEIAEVMVRHGISAVPVTDPEGTVLGVVSEADLLAKLEYTDAVPRHPLVCRRMRADPRKAAGDTVGELMRSPPVTVRPTDTVTAAARRMEAARVKRLPVVDEVGNLVGIVARRDLVRMYTRSDVELYAGISEALLRSLWVDPAELAMTVRAGVVTLAGHVDRRTMAEIVVAFVKATPGVVDVVDRLSCDVDDAERQVAHAYRSIPVRH